ncbi:MAG TPA: response regulator, partial [Fimbriimonas sp.]
RLVDLRSAFADEVTRVARDVGTEGKLGGQAKVPGVSGTWKDLTDNVNGLASNLTDQVRNIALVTTAVANGDLSRKITVEARGEVLQLKDTINTMVDQLNSFADEVTRVAKEVGTEGILGGQAKVPGVAGTWKDLTDSVNVMASNLTTQVRSIGRVVTAVANGDLKQKLVVEAKGEIAALADTINSMTETLGIFADQVTTVAREVGTEGKLGGQAKVPNVAGTWKDLTDNVNYMANSLTVQVREIQDVATAVAQGDLTRTITVDTQGEVQALKDNINQMIFNLRSTTEQNREQDWLKTNLANFSRMMQGQKSLESVSNLIINELTPLVSANHGVFFIADWSTSETMLKLLSAYGYRERKNVANRFHVGEGLVGQCALEKKSILLTNVPNNYIQISSGLGEAPPLNIIVQPILFEGEIMAVLELASFERFSQIHRTFLDQLAESIGVVLNMIQANMRTEELLKQSQSLTQELQSQSEELQSQQEQLKQTNAELEKQAQELEEKASELREQNREVEMKNREVELARAALAERAEQLALTSRYKSEFLANMSHELRTPLNSMLILAKLLADNPDGNLTPKQTKFAETIHISGNELLVIINEILDLSKIEAGKMEIDVTTVPLMEVQDYVDRTFRHMADQSNLDFRVNLDPHAPASLTTDMQRLQQVLRNLLGNAFKFTQQGSVELRIECSDSDLALDDGRTLPADNVVAFRVIDTGVGIPRDKQQLIWEAFQQADGTTSRRFGGTGLGLSISREIAKLLGGRITLSSEPGQGSEFTLYLPIEWTGDSTTHVDLGNLRKPEPTLVSAPPVAPPVRTNGKPVSERTGVADDRHHLQPKDRVLLVVEDDETFANILVVLGRKEGFKVIAAHTGVQGLELAHQYRPDAITLDIMLPDVDGWKVLDQLKRDPDTRHIPVQVVSVVDKNRTAALGAISYLEKPVTTEAMEGALHHIKEFIDKDVKDLLVVEDDEATRQSISEMLADPDVEITSVATGEEAIQALSERQFDCVVLDLALPDMGGLDVLKRVKRQEKYKDLPVIIYTGRDLTKQESAQLKRYATSIVTKGATSGEHLLDQTSLFLHRVYDKMPDGQRESLERRGAVDMPKAVAKLPTIESPTESVDGPLSGSKVLVIDDDYRNIFAITSMLESYGASVLFEENGKDGIDVLLQDPTIGAVLLDVMMPQMDGYEVTRRIRQDERLKHLPVIALTAKAMEGDREKCLAAGADEYITKPVDPKALLEKLSQWLGTQKPEVL